MGCFLNIWNMKSIFSFVGLSKYSYKVENRLFVFIYVLISKLSFLMQITEEQIEKYKTIYVETYGKEIDQTQARAELTSLICLMEAVYKYNNQKKYE